VQQPRNNMNVLVALRVAGEEGEGALVLAIERH